MFTAQGVYYQHLFNEDYDESWGRVGLREKAKMGDKDIERKVLRGDERKKLKERWCTFWLRGKKCKSKSLWGRYRKGLYLSKLERNSFRDKEKEKEERERAWIVRLR